MSRLSMNSGKISNNSDILFRNPVNPFPYITLNKLNAWIF